MRLAIDRPKGNKVILLLDYSSGLSELRRQLLRANCSIFKFQSYLTRTTPRSKIINHEDFFWLPMHNKTLEFVRTEFGNRRVKSVLNEINDLIK